MTQHGSGAGTKPGSADDSKSERSGQEKKRGGNDDHNDDEHKTGNDTCRDAERERFRRVLVDTANAFLLPLGQSYTLFTTNSVDLLNNCAVIIMFTANRSVIDQNNDIC